MKILAVGLLILCGLVLAAAAYVRVRRRRLKRDDRNKEIYPLW
jgi:hypothetical protein